MAALPGIEDLYQLTPLQQGMLFHTLYAPESPAYTIQIDLAVEGKPRREAVESAWGAVLALHPALRTGFVWERVERPYQLVHRSIDAGIGWLDWTSLDAAEQAARRSAWLAADRALAFDLRQPPLIRLTVLRLAPRLSRFVWTFHHIVLEGWSSSVVLADFWKALEAVQDGRAPMLDAPPPYVEYLRWLQRQDRGRAQAYWSGVLRGLGAPTKLPYDRASDGTPAAVHDVGAFTRVLDQDANAAVQALARRLRVTANTVLHGAWALLLSRATGDDDVVFGTVVAGRPDDLPGAERMVGLFVNTLPARVKVDELASLPGWLRRLQLELAALREHAHCGLVDLQNWSGMPAGQALFHSVVAFENWLDAPSQPAAGHAVVERAVHESSDQPLTLFVTFTPRLTLTLMYDVERFDPAPMRRLLDQLHVLLCSMAAAPDAPLAAIDWLAPDEHRRLLVEVNRTATAYPRQATIAERFELQAQATPQALALRQGDAGMRYDELQARSLRLAARLQALGVAHETPVALLVERGFDMVVALLAILRAGGAYLPLDPAYPAVRLAYMLADSRCPLLLTQRSLRDRVPPFEGRVVELDAPEVDEPPPLRASPAGPRSLAYLMYTSGSTGRPKGTCIEQRSVVRLVCGTHFMHLGPDVVFLQYAPIAFDASTLEIWGPLLNGGRLEIAPPGLLSLAELGRVVREGGVNALWLTSALFNQMVTEQLDSLLGVRQLLAGGEAVSVPHARRWLHAMASDACLINGYGPTENTTFTCTHTMRRDTPIGATVPIGRPISNSRGLILDARRRLVPVGVWGELFIGGDGLARGYLNDPALTDERFVPDPFDATPGARLYRSGDRVRWNEDSDIEFGGRIDRQVKLFGLRIEPGEIEAALQRHPQVQDAVVAVLGERAESRRLVAWVVGRNGPAPEAEVLRAHLRELLPASFVPAAFVALPALPLNANGKVDRAALPAPEAVRASEGEHAPPRSERERCIAAVWAELLQAERVGLDDNFFDLGGNSLLVMRVHSRLQSEGQSSLAVVDLFRFPTVRSLAAHLEAGEAPAGAADAAAERLKERAAKRRQAIRRQQRA